ncbi:hypothetical protein ACROYT_G012405 [Oculina patagonica]
MAKKKVTKLLCEKLYEDSVKDHIDFQTQLVLGSVFQAFGYQGSSVKNSIRDWSMQWSHDTSPRPGQDLYACAQPITRGVAAMDSCFVLDEEDGNSRDESVDECDSESDDDDEVDAFVDESDSQYSCLEAEDTLNNARVLCINVNTALSEFADDRRLASRHAMASSLQQAQEHGELHSSASKLKVTILASEWGSSKGRLSTINRELAIQLAKCPEVEITLFLPQCSEENKRAALGHNITIVKATRRPGYDELEWLSFPPDHLNIDVIVGHGVKLGRQAQFIRESHKCKWVQVVHTDPEELGMFKSYENPISKGENKHRTEVELCEMADFVVGVGPKLSEAFRSYLRWCKKDQTVFDITPGVFNEFVNVEHAAEERKRCGVLVFGRGDAEDFQLKGFDIAGKAVAQLKDAHLVFVGAPEGQHEDIAKRLLACGIPASRLTVRSFLQSREELKRLFCEVDLVLMPSRTEGFGLTGLEALSAGLPVLVSKNSEFGEALHKVPFGSSCVIDSEDDKVWAEAINGIWNKDRETRLQKAEVLRSSYERKYSWAKQSQDLVAKMINIVHVFINCQRVRPSGRPEGLTRRQNIEPREDLYMRKKSQKHSKCREILPELISHKKRIIIFAYHPRYSENDMIGEQYAAMSIICQLHRTHSNPNKFNKETDLSEDLKKIAADKGFIISDNPASGNCMFYALSEQLQSAKGIQISEQELRKKLVELLVKYPNLPDGTDLFNFVHGYPSWADYLRGMGKDGTWGDHLILRAAANCYKTRIRVISSLDCDVIITPDHGTVDNTIPLVLGHIHEKHYCDHRGEVSLENSVFGNGRYDETDVMFKPEQISTVPKFTSSNEESNYARLCQLLVTVGSGVLSETFDRVIPPKNLQKHLKGFRVHETLQSLRKQGILSSKQWGQLYPAHASSVSSKDFDPTLLMVLLRTICELTPPTAGWDTPPLAADCSREADIARVRYFINTVFSHEDKAFVSDAVFMDYWENIREMLVRLGGAGYGDAVDEMKNQNMDPLTEEHYKELFKQWKKNENCVKDKMNELESVMEASGEEDISYPSHVIERIRQIYKTREERVLPVPWCDDFSFHLSEIFTRLRIVNREKTRGTLTEEITNMTAIFKAHEGCQKPRTVLIEGDPGKGKTTYCQKLAYDWANRQEEWDESFPEIELLLLLRCHDIKSSIWEAIDDQILPEDIDEESKENFFKFIRENQSKVLLVLDGLDEADPSKLPMYIKLVESRELPECRVILTSRHEAGMKFRRLCDTLWEIVGFTWKDAQSFIFKHFKDMKHLADKLLRKLSHRSGSRHLREMTSNPLNTALLCVLCEDFEGDLPKSRTELYIEIVLCVLRRYENKRDLSSDSEDLIKVYKEELIHLGHMALISLRNGELYIEKSKRSSNSTALSKFGFLSVQAAGSRRKRCLRYGFLHKSFQEFLAGFYLASKILSGEIDLDTVVADKRYLNELKQVFLFMSGIIVSQCEETAVCLVKSMTAHINCLGSCTPNGENEINSNVKLAFDCIKECVSRQENLRSRLVCSFGSHLDLQTLELHDRLDSHCIEYFAEALAVNTKLTSLRLSENEIDPCGAGLVSDALAVNTTLTNLDLSGNKIGPSGAGSLSKALAVNTTLADMNLKFNAIENSGADSLFQALLVNTTLTSLRLRANSIDVSCVDSLSEALTANATLTDLDLGGNWLGQKLAAGVSLSKALEANTALTKLDLHV